MGQAIADQGFPKPQLAAGPPSRRISKSVSNRAPSARSGVAVRPNIMAGVRAVMRRNFRGHVVAFVDDNGVPVI